MDISIILNSLLFIIVAFLFVCYIYLLEHSCSKLKLQIRILQQKKDSSNIPPTHTENGLFSSDIYKKFKEQSSLSYTHLDNKDWELLEKTILTYYHDFNEKVGKLTSLNNNEYKISLLLKCKFKPTEISKLICQSKENVTSVRRRLCQKHIDSLSASPQKWDQFINKI